MNSFGPYFFFLQLFFLISEKSIKIKWCVRKTIRWFCLMQCCWKIVFVCCLQWFLPVPFRWKGILTGLRQVPLYRYDWVKFESGNHEQTSHHFVCDFYSERFIQRLFSSQFEFLYKTYVNPICVSMISEPIQFGISVISGQFDCKSQVKVQARQWKLINSIGLRDSLNVWITDEL